MRLFFLWRTLNFLLQSLEYNEVFFIHLLVGMEHFRTITRLFQ